MFYKYMYEFFYFYFFGGLGYEQQQQKKVLERVELVKHKINKFKKKKNMMENKYITCAL